MTSTTLEKPKKKFDRRSARYKELLKAHNYIKWYDDRASWPSYAKLSKHMGYNPDCNQAADLLTDMALAGMIVRIPVKGARHKYNYKVIR